jgi:1-acyl-sn-glycerol-3-phosphate acyltransferase
VPRSELNRWWRIGAALAAPLIRLLLRVRIEGIERVPLGGPAVLAFNHVSVLDGPVLAVVTARRLRRPTRYLVAAEMFKRRLIGWILRRYGQISIRRGQGDSEAIDVAMRSLREGGLVGIAPEGRVGDDPERLQRMRSGVARIALPTEAPVVPVAIWGTQRRWPRTGLRLGRPLRPRVGISFGGPILPTGDVSDERDVEVLVGRVRERLEEQLDRARALAR